MGHDYNTNILVNWGALLFILERRFQAAVRRYKDTAEEFNGYLARSNQVACNKQAGVLLLDCEEVIELAGLSNSVRLFVGWDAVRYDLAEVRAIRSELRKHLEEVQQS